MEYTMVIQVLTKFQLKTNLIGEAVVKKVILPQICPIYGPSLAQILSKIARSEWISKFSKIYHGNTHTDRVSSQNDHDWWWYCQKGNFATNKTHVWHFCGQIIPNYPNIK